MILCLPPALILIKNGSLFIDTQKVFILLEQMLRTWPMKDEQMIDKIQEQLDAVKRENELLRQELSSLKEGNDRDRSVSFKEKYAVKILDSLPDMLTVFTHDEIGVEVVSSEETNHVGISNKEFVGMRMCDMIPADAYQNVHANMQKVFATGKVSIAHHELQVGGEHHCYENRIFPLDNKYVLVMCRDTTDIQHIEQELIKARIKAEQSDRLKTAFLANMSHEIRTPLNAIVGFSTLLAAAENLEEQRLYSDIINQNSDILLQLINDILDLSKIEAGTLEYVRRPMDLGELCRTIYEVHKGRVCEGVRLILDNKDESLVINEDNNRIMQVITNLITNAIKFTNRGEIRFGYEVKKRYIDFYVKDTGIGIEDDKVDHIFDRFVKLNSFVQGTGLGLAICRMIIEKIGGEISVISCLGLGSAFHFTIPYEGEQEPAKLSDSPKEPEENNAMKRAQQVKTILIAEDVESNFFLLKNLLGKDYTLLWAKDGVEVVDMFKEYNPDLILMDIKMPRRNGLEATRIIRSYSLEIPIIALTAYAFEADKEEAFAAGCNDFVTKPISRSVLMKALAKYSVTVEVC